MKAPKIIHWLLAIAIASSSLASPLAYGGLDGGDPVVTGHAVMSITSVVGYPGDFDLQPTAARASSGGGVTTALAITNYQSGTSQGEVLLAFARANSEAVYDKNCRAQNDSYISWSNSTTASVQTVVVYPRIVVDSNDAYVVCEFEFGDTKIKYETQGNGMLDKTLTVDGASWTLPVQIPEDGEYTDPTTYTIDIPANSTWSTRLWTVAETDSGLAKADCMMTIQSN